jgi:hypothetical protein
LNDEGLIENLMMLFTGYKEVSWLSRDVLTNCDSFECARHHLATEKVNSLCYFILAGTQKDEGVVITRYRFDEAHENWLNSTAGTWFIVQTNSDHYDVGCNNRCAAASDNMNKLGQADLNLSSMADSVLKKFPNTNYLSVYHTLFNPSQSLINTYYVDYHSSTVYPNDDSLYDMPVTLLQKLKRLETDKYSFAHDFLWQMEEMIW